jgi:hypothetical protein
LIQIRVRARHSQMASDPEIAWTKEYEDALDKDDAYARELAPRGYKFGLKTPTCGWVGLRMALAGKGREGDAAKASRVAWIAMRLESNADQAVAHNLVKPLVTLTTGSVQLERELAAAALWNMAVTRAAEVLEAGALDPLQAMLKAETGEEAENAAGAITSICAGRAGVGAKATAYVIEKGGFDLLWHLILTRPGRAGEMAGQAMHYMAQSAGADPLVSAGLVGRVREAMASKDPVVLTGVLRPMRRWLSRTSPALQRVITLAGVTGTVVRLLGHADSAVVGAAVSALTGLCDSSDGSFSVVANGALPVLVALLSTPAHTGPVGVLLAQMCEVPEIRSVALDCGVVAPLREVVSWTDSAAVAGAARLLRQLASDPKTRCMLVEQGFLTLCEDARERGMIEMDMVAERLVM